MAAQSKASARGRSLPRGAIASHWGGGSFVISFLIILNIATELASHTNAGRVAGSDPRSWPDKIMYP